MPNFLSKENINEAYLNYSKIMHGIVERTGVTMSNFNAVFTRKLMLVIPRK